MAVHGNNVKLVDLSIKEDNAKEGARTLMKHVRPQWNQSEINFIVFTEGITNILIGCYEGKNKDDIVLVRIYGKKTDLIIDRQTEMTNMQILHSVGLAPPLYCKFNNGIAYGFVKGVCLDEPMAKDLHISSIVATEVAAMHQIDPDRILGDDGKPMFDISKEPGLYKKLKKWIELGPDSFDDSAKDQKFQKEILRKPKLLEELCLLEDHLSQLNAKVVFVHHDLLLNNIVYNKEKEKIMFIDYEYGAFGYAPFDLGNHFNEFAGIDVVDYSLYPKKDFQVQFIRCYLEAEAKLEGRIPSDVTERDVERLYVQVNKFALASHFYWGLWGLIQAKYSTIDFDYLDYAKIRFDEYFRRREEFFALKMPDQ